jgi:protein TonB
MYLNTHKSGKGTKMFGAVAAVALTIGAGVGLSVMNINAEKTEIVRTELVMIEPPPPPPVEIPEPPKIEVVEETPAPPEAPPLVAPDLDFVPEEIPVITAAVADPVPAPDPVPVAPAPSTAVQTATNPKLIASDKPAYPSASRRAGEQGTTHLQVCVNAGGRVTSVSVATSSGYQRLDEAAAKWIRGERFTPAKVNGASKDVCGYSVFYEWTLRDA